MTKMSAQAAERILEHVTAEPAPAAVIAKRAKQSLAQTVEALSALRHLGRVAAECEETKWRNKRWVYRRVA